MAFLDVEVDRKRRRKAFSPSRPEAALRDNCGERPELRGLRRPVAAFNVVHSTSAVDARPNLTVVARGPGPD